MAGSGDISEADYVLDAWVCSYSELVVDGLIEVMKVVPCYVQMWLIRLVIYIFRQLQRAKEKNIIDVVAAKYSSQLPCLFSQTYSRSIGKEKFHYGPDPPLTNNVDKSIDHNAHSYSNP